MTPYLLYNEIQRSLGDRVRKVVLGTVSSIMELPAISMVCLPNGLVRASLISKGQGLRYTQFDYNPLTILQNYRLGFLQIAITNARRNCLH
jgi:hypothetical protein